MDKFRNKYRIPSARLSNWDYRNAAAYFITICTKHRECYLGNIVNGKMHLSDTGILADVVWYEIKKHAKNIELGEFVVMPNHIHGILILQGNNVVAVKTLHATSLQQSSPFKNEIMANISPRQGSVSTIIRSYKSAVSKHAHRLGLEFEWQERFHDHIIRNETEYQRIADYIVQNPANWNNDDFFQRHY